MKVGGKFWQAAQAQQRRGQWAKQMNRQIIRQHELAMRVYGNALFETNIVHGHERAKQVVMQYAQRITGEMQARFENYGRLSDSLKSLSPSMIERATGNETVAPDKRDGVDVLV